MTQHLSENPEESATADGTASPSEPSINNEEPEPEVAADPELEFEHGGNGSDVGWVHFVNRMKRWVTQSSANEI